MLRFFSIIGLILPGDKGDPDSGKENEACREALVCPQEPWARYAQEIPASDSESDREDSPSRSPSIPFMTAEQLPSGPFCCETTPQENARHPDAAEGR